jgi:hypothetical protein
MGALDHVSFTFVEEGFGEGVLLPVLVSEGRVGVGDSNQFNFVMARQGVEQSVYMPVLEADNGDAERGGISLRGGDFCGGREQKHS